ncbi:hypothetical protein EBB07_27485 [Paenibacillaceae bacterium]|nr:hypothetical protein EBB07_27485 [Paenibacillaceae bacterium]
MKRLLGMLLIASIMLGGGVLFKPAMAYACSCAERLTPAEELERGTAVFAGEVTAIESKEGKVISSGDPIKVTFKVSEIWKGEVGSLTDVYTAGSSASCGYDKFEVNQTYIVYASGVEDKLQTGICTRTALLADATEDLQQLGKGEAPPAKEYKSLKGEHLEPRKDFWWILIAITIVVLAAGIAVAAWQLRKKK